MLVTRGERMTEPKNPEEPITKNILATGIPLEMAVHDLLASDLKADWILPDYDFVTLDESGAAKRRSVDFAVSVPSYPEGLGEETVRLYLLLECKYSDPNKRVWLFMPDVSPKIDTVFDGWRPALWQDRAPQEPTAPQQVQDIVSSQTTPHSSDQGIQYCVRGTVLGVKDDEKLPNLTSAMHQLRDCLHSLAIERFRLFTKQWSKPAALIFVPIVVTNAELRLLRPGLYSKLLSSSGDQRRTLNDVSTNSERLLVRCPTALDKVEWNWQRFQSAHGASDLSRFERGLPVYKRERTVESHLKNFFAVAPTYVVVVRLEGLSKLMAEVCSWAKALEFC